MGLPGYGIQRVGGLGDQVALLQECLASLSPSDFELATETLREAELLSAEIASIQNSLRDSTVTAYQPASLEFAKDKKPDTCRIGAAFIHLTGFEHCNTACLHCFRCTTEDVMSCVAAPSLVALSSKPVLVPAEVSA